MTPMLTQTSMTVFLLWRGNTGGEITIKWQKSSKSTWFVDFTSPVSECV